MCHNTRHTKLRQEQLQRVGSTILGDEPDDLPSPTSLVPVWREWYITGPIQAIVEENLPG
jgi:hypothetical protein